MKKVNLFKSLTASLVIGLVVLSTSCGEDINGVIPEGDIVPSVVTEDTYLSADTEWKINGDVHVKSGATLTIEAGATLVGQSSVLSYLLIEKGGKIVAEGTADAPIVFTSDLKEAGAWGGLHVCGDAPINVEGGAGSSEIGDSPYGGNNAADDSGIIKYCRFEYTGTALSETKESNGVSFYGVGNGTTVEYVQVYEGADDGFEFFGGTVNVKYLVSQHAQDDSFDWTEGWSGNGQFLIAKQKAGVGDRGIEGDNNGDNNAASPFANPTLSQVTLIGGGKIGKYGMKLREGTKGKFYNFVVSGFEKRTIHVEHNQTLANVNDGSLIVDYSYVNNTASDASIKYSVSKITNPDYDPNDPNSEEEINDPNGPVVDDAKKFETSSNIFLQDISTATIATTYTGGYDAASLGAFFTSSTQIGAGDNWTTGWTTGL